MPVLQGRAAPDRRGREREARRRSRAVPRAGGASTQIRLPRLRGCRRPGAGPARLIEGGLPTEATMAHVLASKYADHLPLYRQAQICARQGVHLDRSTLARRRRRCSIPGAGGPRPASSGPMRETIGPGAGPPRRRSHMSTRLTERPPNRSRTSPASRAFSRSTATPAIGRRLRRLSRARQTRPKNTAYDLSGRPALLAARQGFQRVYAPETVALSLCNSPGAPHFAIKLVSHRCDRLDQFLFVRDAIHFRSCDDLAQADSATKESGGTAQGIINKYTDHLCKFDSSRVSRMA